jgi:O-antigen/teichoic acid export membrane protein
MSEKLIQSSSLMVATRFLQRSLGLVSTLILARILLPEDFGVIAFLAIVVHFFSILSLAGSQQYIISKPTVDDDDLNTSWTINIILSFALWLILILLTPTIVAYFNMGIAQNGLYVLSITIFINALSNPGIWLYKKALNYKKFFILEVTAKSCSFFIVIILAFLNPTFWAIIWGDIVSVTILFMGSYFLHPFRPKFSKSKFKIQWSYSKWMFLKGILTFLKQHLDNLLVSKLFNPSSLGGYYLSKDIVSMPATQLMNPATEPLLVTFSNNLKSPENFLRHFNLVFITITIIVAPISLFIWFYSKYIVIVILGDKWLSTISIFSYFSIFMFATCYQGLLLNVCISKRKIKSIFIYDLLSVIFTTALLLGYTNYTLETFALTRSLLEIFLTFFLLFYTLKVIKGSALTLITLLIPIIFCPNILFNVGVIIFYLHLVCFLMK